MRNNDPDRRGGNYNFHSTSTGEGNWNTGGGFTGHGSMDNGINRPDGSRTTWDSGGRHDTSGAQLNSGLGLMRGLRPGMVRPGAVMPPRVPMPPIGPRISKPAVYPGDIIPPVDAAYGPMAPGVYDPRFNGNFSYPTYTPPTYTPPSGPNVTEIFKTPYTAPNTTVINKTPDPNVTNINKTPANQGFGGFRGSFAR
jgi:hypothetical protein